MAGESALNRIWNRAKRFYEVRVTRHEPPTNRIESPTIIKLRASFENREAVYIEKGATLVRVTNIWGSLPDTTVWADVEEVLASGLGVGMFAPSQSKTEKPKRWQICAGFMSNFSEQYWRMGYGGWSLYFDPGAVQSVLDLASQFAGHLDTHEAYKKIINLLEADPTWLHLPAQPVFPGSDLREK